MTSLIPDTTYKLLVAFPVFQEVEKTEDLLPRI